MPYKFFIIKIQDIDNLFESLTPYKNNILDLKGIFLAIVSNSNLLKFGNHV